MALDLPDLKILGQEAQTRASMCHQKLWWSPASFHALLRADAGLSRASRADWDMSRAPTRCTRQALTRASVPWCHIPLQSDPFVQADPIWPIYPNSVQTACKKKKKKLWPSRTLTLTKKSKFSKMACSTQFFEYIPILRSVSSFEARKLCKLSNS